MEAAWNNGLLRLAFHTSDAALANSEKIKTLPGRMASYCGAKHVTSLSFVAVVCRNLFKKEQNRWK
jgi:hypothetical protein